MNENNEDRTKLSLPTKDYKLDEKDKEIAGYINKFLENEQRWISVNKISKAINSTLTLRAIYDFIEKDLANLLDVDMCAICTLNRTNGTYMLHNVRTETQRNYLLNFLCENIQTSSNTDIEKTSLQEELNKHLEKGYKTVPLFHQSNILGLLFIYKKNKEITEEHMKLLNLAADSISMGLINAYLYAELKNSNDRKLEFLANLSHEFKTPLNAINGFASLMFEKELSREKCIKFLKNIKYSAVHLLQVAEYTVDMAKAETDKIYLSYETFHSDEIIQEVLDIMDVKRISKNIELIIDFNGGIIKADLKRIRQVLFNLIGNAYKYTNKNGRVLVSTHIDENKFYFEIKDNGQGIIIEEQDKIFEFFTHITKAQHSEESSSGIGLSLSKKIIELHNGKITFKSKPNEGSTFWFNIPRCQTKLKT